MASLEEVDVQVNDEQTPPAPLNTDDLSHMFSALGSPHRASSSAIESLPDGPLALVLQYLIESTRYTRCVCMCVCVCE